MPRGDEETRGRAARPPSTPPPRGAALSEHLSARAAEDPRLRQVTEIVERIAQGAARIADRVVGDVEGATGAKEAPPVERGRALLRGAIGSAGRVTFSDEDTDGAPGDAPIVLIQTLDVLSRRTDAAAVLLENGSTGTIFSVWPGDRNPARDPGSRQLAAGIVLYGPRTTMAVTTGAGAHSFVRRPGTESFFVTHETLAIPENTSEYGIDTSNYRHWDLSIRDYVDDCVLGANGPLGVDFQLRWTGSLVADVYRVLMHGGIFLGPSDQRVGCSVGCYRLVFEASPIAMLVEQAGGRATNGVDRILDVTPSALDQRTALVCGSRREVERVALYRTRLPAVGSRSPLFAQRGLFRR